MAQDAIISRTAEIARQRLSEQVASQLQDDIIHDGLEPGHVLPPEKVLAIQFGVSRTVIREAINQLTTKGLVNVVHGKGTVVAPRTNWNVVDMSLLKGLAHSLVQLTELRKILEVEAAGLAAERATEEDLQACREALSRYEEDFERPERRLQADIDFHNAIIKATQNNLLPIILEPVTELLKSSRMATLAVPAGAARSRIAHRRLLEALEQRDVIAARQAATEHLDQVLEDLKAAGIR